MSGHSLESYAIGHSACSSDFRQNRPTEPLVSGRLYPLAARLTTEFTPVPHEGDMPRTRQAILQRSICAELESLQFVAPSEFILTLRVSAS